MFHFLFFSHIDRRLSFPCFKYCEKKKTMLIMKYIYYMQPRFIAILTSMVPFLEALHSFHLDIFQCSLLEESITVYGQYLKYLALFLYDQLYERKSNKTTI